MGWMITRPGEHKDLYTTKLERTKAGAVTFNLSYPEKILAILDHIISNIFQSWYDSTFIRKGREWFFGIMSPPAAAGPIDIGVKIPLIKQE